MGCWFNDLLPEPPPQVSVAGGGSLRSVLVRHNTLPARFPLLPVLPSQDFVRLRRRREKRVAGAPRASSQSFEGRSSAKPEELLLRLIHDLVIRLDDVLLRLSARSAGRRSRRLTLRTLLRRASRRRLILRVEGLSCLAVGA